MNFDIITLFPEMFLGPLSESILKRATKKGLIEINFYQLRDSATDKHKTVDDTPYGGGAGMVIKVDVVDKALSKIINKIEKRKNIRTILLTPKGKKFTQQKAIELSKYDNIILLCGHYEGFDQRVHDHLVDEEISIGDFVLTGGELPAMVMIDAISRMVPGVIKEESMQNESFMPPSTKLRIQRKYEITNITNINKSTMNQCSNETMNLDFPVYTRPLEYKGLRVPDILLSGNHAEIEKWRKTRQN